MARLFGTDGIRGKANEELTNEIAYRLGRAVAIYQGKKVLLARDTRISGQMLESALCAGITSVGGEAILVGIIPTPAVAMLVRKHEFDAGIMISASHNPPEYNGLKVFDSKGYKLPDAVEDKIEAYILQKTQDPEPVVAGDAVGTISFLDDARHEYVDFIVDSIKSQNISFEGMKIALDCGHGASYFTSPEALSALGAEVIAINTDFDGTDINVQCGSTHLEPLQKLVKESGADLGIAHDGDADRVMMISHDGAEIDGDIVLNVCAKDMSSRDVLKGDTVVGTVMSNLGLTKALEKENISLVQTKVGDRYVLEEMLAKGYSIGGEQSGHVILLDYNTTGDGLMTAVQFLAAVKRLSSCQTSNENGSAVDDAIAGFTRYPQVLINVKVADKEAAMSGEAAHAAVKEAEEALGDTGRVLLRPSGTEPVVRVMVEAQDEAVANKWANEIASKLS